MAASSIREGRGEPETVRSGVYPTSIAMGVISGAFLGKKNTGMYVQWEVSFLRESDQSNVVFLTGICMDSSWNGPSGKVHEGSKCINFLPQGAGDIPFGTFETLMDEDGEHWIKFKLPRSEELTWAQYTEVLVIAKEMCIGKRKNRDTCEPRDKDDARSYCVSETCALEVVTYAPSAAVDASTNVIGSTQVVCVQHVSVLHDSDYESSDSEGCILGDSDYETDAADSSIA